MLFECEQLFVGRSMTKLKTAERETIMYASELRKKVKQELTEMKT